MRVLRLTAIWAATLFFGGMAALVSSLTPAWAQTDTVTPGVRAEADTAGMHAFGFLFGTDFEVWIDGVPFIVIGRNGNAVGSRSPELEGRTQAARTFRAQRVSNGDTGVCGFGFGSAARVERHTVSLACGVARTVDDCDVRVDTVDGVTVEGPYPKVGRLMSVPLFARA